MTTIDFSDARPARTWWRAPVIWTTAVICYAAVLRVQIGLPFLVALRGSAVYLYSLALLTYPLRRWSGRAMARQQPALSFVLKHAAFGVLTIVVWLGVNLLHDWWTLGPAFWQIVYANSWMFQLLFALMVYGTVLGLTLTSQSWTRERERERREAALVLAAREAELGAIRAQFQPHFVLNALNSLLALIDKEPALARTMVVRLADLMKAVFDRADTPTVPLERELDLARAYLDVERIRFGSRLTVAFDIEDAARGVMVPPFLLQPLVENAVKHGIAPYARPGEVRLSARVHERRLEVVVRDSGGGHTDALALGTGLGLPLTRRRLETLYGQGYELTVDPRPDGTSVRVDIPVDRPDAA